MSAEKQETAADILKEMRAFKRYAQSESSDCRYVAYWTYETFPARLEAAWKRERELGAEAAQICGELGEAIGRASGGNAAAMREALLRCNAIAQLPECRNLQAIKDMRGIIRAALSAPPRNCDVGTAEEQTQRHIDHCRVHVCKECKYRWLRGSCSLAWAQAPYEKEVAK